MLRTSRSRQGIPQGEAWYLLTEQPLELRVLELRVAMSRDPAHDLAQIWAAMKKTLYQILGVDPKASAQDIEAAYAARIDELKFATLHDPNKLRVLQQSKDVLADPIQRASYDASISKPETPASSLAQEVPEPSFLRQWGRWIAAVVVLIGLFVLWPKRAATPPPAKQIASRPIEPVPQPVPPAAPNDVPAPAPSVEPPADLRENPVLGEWSCTDAISGRTSKYNFQQDGVLSIASSDGQALTLKYELSGKVLTLTDPKQATALAIEELVARKMILNTGAEGRRLVCKR